MADVFGGSRMWTSTPGACFSHISTWADLQAQRSVISMPSRFSLCLFCLPPLLCGFVFWKTLVEHISTANSLSQHQAESGHMTSSCSGAPTQLQKNLRTSAEGRCFTKTWNTYFSQLPSSNYTSFFVSFDLKFSCQSSFPPERSVAELQPRWWTPLVFEDF